MSNLNNNYFLPVSVRQQESSSGGDERLHHPESGQRGLPDQHPGLQLPADVGPPVLPDPGDGESDQPHQPDCLHTQREGGQARDRGPDDQQMFQQVTICLSVLPPLRPSLLLKCFNILQPGQIVPTVQDHRPGQPGETDQVREEANRLLLPGPHWPRSDGSPVSPDAPADIEGSVSVRARPGQVSVWEYW